MDERERQLSERRDAAMQEYWRAQLQISREYLLLPGHAPTHKTMERANVARVEVVILSRQIARTGEKAGAH